MTVRSRSLHAGRAKAARRAATAPGRFAACRRRLGELAAAFSPHELRQLFSVADSAFVTPDHLDAAAPSNLNFLSRLPETCAVVHHVKDDAWAGPWEPLVRISPGGQVSCGARPGGYSSV